MLTALSIRDIVLIEKLDLVLDQGLTVLSGETGAGKSILLDALGLALGARGDSGLVRAGADKGVVTASFALAADHRALRLLAEQGIELDGELIVRRVQGGDGKSRAFVNDQPVGIGLLRQLGTQLAEIHGQHDDRALVDVASHRDLLDAFGGLQPLLAAAGTAWAAWQENSAAVEAQRARVARAEAEREFLEHSVAELGRLAPSEREEEELAERRQLMMHAEQFAGLIVEVEKALGGSLDAELNAVLRKIERRAGQAMGKLDGLAGALDRLLIEIGEATRAAGEAGREFAFDPGDLERAEERLFALRAAARKHKVKVDDLPAVLVRMTADLQSLVDGGDSLRRLEAEEAASRSAYVDAAGRLGAARRSAAERLDRAVMAELPPLKLERATFTTVVESDASRPAAHGIDRVEFMVTANPGVPVAPLTKVASGGELARFMLALKVVLAARGSAPTLIFDEIDTGVGGATADAMGLRLSRLAAGLQVVCVTHSPQVAARADHHLLIAKSETKARMVTRVEPLAPLSRREEIARMLSGSQVTDEARAQADRLLSRAG
ncbi:MAG TPA: DNA repair protein RecN [Allosphingosinicella sp.]|nr:DNA repair protein RecN [Allosphingosinicella sp.]